MRFIWECDPRDFNLLTSFVLKLPICPYSSGVKLYLRCYIRRLVPSVPPSIHPLTIMSITRQLEHYIPPGIIFVVQALSLNILPIVGISYALLTVTGNIFTISLPRHVFWAILFASVPTIYILNIFVHETRKRLGARAIHAALPPTWDGKLPGNYDILKQSLDVISSGYIGIFSKL